MSDAPTRSAELLPTTLYVAELLMLPFFAELLMLPFFAELLMLPFFWLAPAIVHVEGFSVPDEELSTMQRLAKHLGA